MSANDSTQVSTGKPKVGGAIYAAPLGTALPTDPTTALDKAFKSLGYVSEDGLANDNAPDTDTVRAWGGDAVLTIQNSKDDTFGFTLIHSLDVDVLKFVYGSSNVSGDLATGITVKANAAEAEARALVIDMIMRDGALKRIVIPSCTVTDLGTITYSDSDAVGYETTVTCTPDASGNTHYEYIKRAAA